ncbi:MAG: response regulator [Limisphaerales bacterium]
MNAVLKLPVPETRLKNSPRARRKIMLVDDDSAIRQMLARLLTGEGYDVLLAVSGSEAVQVVRAADIDLVLLDLNMPGMDGWETFEKLAAENPLLPIVVITARPHQSFTALAAGIGALLEKPLDLPKLFHTIRDLLGEPDEIRLARVAGRPSEFHYVPPSAAGVG